MQAFTTNAKNSFENRLCTRFASLTNTPHWMLIWFWLLLNAFLAVRIKKSSNIRLTDSKIQIQVNFLRFQIKVVTDRDNITYIYLNKYIVFVTYLSIPCDNLPRLDNFKCKYLTSRLVFECLIYLSVSCLLIVVVDHWIKTSRELCSDTSESDLKLETKSGLWILAVLTSLHSLIEPEIGKVLFLILPA